MIRNQPRSHGAAAAKDQAASAEDHRPAYAEMWQRQTAQERRRDVEGLSLALSDWSIELRILEGAEAEAEPPPDG